MKLLFNAVCIILVATNLAAVIIPFESWPFTNAPMFAHYVDQSTPRYCFRFAAKEASGKEVELGYYSVGAHWSLMRFFFKYVYGSAETHSVFSVYPHDTESAFRARLAAFFEAFIREYKARNENRPCIASLELIVERLAWKDNAALERKRIASYYPAQGNIEYYGPFEEQ